MQSRTWERLLPSASYKCHKHLSVLVAPHLWHHLLTTASQFTNLGNHSDSTALFQRRIYNPKPTNQSHRLGHRWPWEWTVAKTTRKENFAFPWLCYVSGIWAWSYWRLSLPPPWGCLPEDDARTKESWDDRQRFLMTLSPWIQQCLKPSRHPNFPVPWDNIYSSRVR